MGSLTIPKQRMIYYNDTLYVLGFSKLAFDSLSLARADVPPLLPRQSRVFVIEISHSYFGQLYSPRYIL